MRLFQGEEPGFEPDTTGSTVAMQAAIAAEDTVARNDQRDGIGSLHAPNRPGGARVAQTFGNTFIGGSLPVRDGLGQEKHLHLKRRHPR